MVALEGNASIGFASSSAVSRGGEEDLFLAETSCNLPTYINTMLRFAFRSPYEPLHCTSSRKMRERGAGAPRGGGWEAGCEKRSRVESRQPNFATLASRYFDVSRHGSRSPRRFFFFFFFKPAVSVSRSKWRFPETERGGSTMMEETRRSLINLVIFLPRSIVEG